MQYAQQLEEKKVQPDEHAIRPKIEHVTAFRNADYLRGSAVQSAHSFRSESFAATYRGLMQSLRAPESLAHRYGHQQARRIDSGPPLRELEQEAVGLTNDIEPEKCQLAGQCLRVNQGALSRPWFAVLWKRDKKTPNESLQPHLRTPSTSPPSTTPRPPA